MSLAGASIGAFGGVTQLVFLFSAVSLKFVYDFCSLRNEHRSDEKTFLEITPEQLGAKASLCDVNVTEYGDFIAEVSTMCNRQVQSCSSINKPFIEQTYKKLNLAA